MKNKSTGNDIATGLEIFENFICCHLGRYWLMSYRLKCFEKMIEKNFSRALEKIFKRILHTTIKI